MIFEWSERAGLATGHTVLRSLAADALLVAALCALGWSSFWTPPSGQVDLGMVGVVVVLGQVVPLLARRRLPLVSSVVVSASATTYVALGHPTGPLALTVLVVMAAVASRRRGAPAVAGLAAGLAGVIAIAFLKTPASDISQAVANAALVLAAWTSGVSLRLRRARDAALQAKERSEASLVVEQARGVLDRERLALADAVHDRVGHALAALLRQAEAAQRAGPEHRAHLLTRMTATSRTALRDMEAMVDALSRKGEPWPALAGVSGMPGMPAASWTAAVAPPEDIAAVLRHWLAQLGAAGLEVCISTGGMYKPLPEATEVLVGRVLAEGLANVARHSDATRVEVRLLRGAGQLEVLVSDPGPCRTSEPAVQGCSSGHPAPFGLHHLAVEMAHSGAELSWGALLDGGFRLRACLPVGQTADATELASP